MTSSIYALAITKNYFENVEFIFAICESECGHMCNGKAIFIQTIKRTRNTKYRM